MVGSINRDFVLKVERRARPGETLTDAALELHEGGKGANQAVAAARLGAEVSILGRIGEDEIGPPLLRSLEENGVDVKSVSRDPERATGSAFIAVTPDGENSITVAPGANRGLSVADVEAARERIEAAAVVVAQLEIPPEVVEQTAGIVRESGGRMLLNFAPARRAASPGLVRGADPLVVNEIEAGILLGDPERVADPEAAMEAAPELLALGAGSVVITLGGAGAVCAAENFGPEHVPAPEVEVVDTTGAGDAFVGALAARLSFGDTFRDAVGLAVLAGSAAVTGAGAQGALPTPEQLRRP
ncbi:ribokinase [Rubrobacter indicoceani]|uniref:ribokinase n=1 Tax=Rubrobacter indicoceani TaxID=2051957 RepID=UPI001968A7B5|nr:ribokinase [Rubrobacter indicoceani]